MSFSDRFDRSLGLARATYEIVKQEKGMLLYPIISGFILLGIFASLFFGGVFGAILIIPTKSSGAFITYIITLIYLFYVATYFVTSFFKVAIIDTTLNRLNGIDPHLLDGIKKSFSNLGKIFRWSLLAASVGLLLTFLSRMSNRDNPLASIIQRIIISIVGAAWSIVTYFVLPVAVYEKKGIFDSMKRTVGLLRGSWIEAFLVNSGIGLIFGLINILFFIPLLLGIFMQNFYLVVIGAVLGFISVLVIGIIRSVFNSVIVGVLYNYSKNGKLPPSFARLSKK